MRLGAGFASRRVVLLSVALSGCACGPSSPPVAAHELAPEPLAGETIDGCFVQPGAPDPYACATADDCTVGALFLPSTCCLSGVSHPHSAAYHAWQTTLFRERCDGSCVQPPSPPSECELAVRCDAGRCVNACDELPSPSDTALDAMDRSELETLCEGGSSAACDRLGH